MIDRARITSHVSNAELDRLIDSFLVKLLDAIPAPTEPYAPFSPCFTPVLENALELPECAPLTLGTPSAVEHLLNLRAKMKPQPLNEQYLANSDTMSDEEVVAVLSASAATLLFADSQPCWTKEENNAPEFTDCSSGLESRRDTLFEAVGAGS